MNYETKSLKSSRDRVLHLIDRETSDKPWFQQDLRQSHGIFRYYRWNADDSFPVSKPTVYEVNELSYSEGKLVRNTILASVTSIQGVSTDGMSADIETIFTVDKVGKKLWVNQRTNVGRDDEELIHPEMLAMYSLFDVPNQSVEMQWIALERTLTDQ